jgi:hypothetical protein
MVLGFKSLTEEFQEKALIKTLTRPDPISVILAEVRHEAFGMFLYKVTGLKFVWNFLLDCHLIVVLILALLPDQSALPGPNAKTTLVYMVFKVRFGKYDTYVLLSFDILNYVCCSTNHEE